MVEARSLTANIVFGEDRHTLAVRMPVVRMWNGHGRSHPPGLQAPRPETQSSSAPAAAGLPGYEASEALVGPGPWSLKRLPAF